MRILLIICINVEKEKRTKMGKKKTNKFIWALNNFSEELLTGLGIDMYIQTHIRPI